MTVRAAPAAPAGLGTGMTQRFVLLIVLFVTGSAYMLTDVFSPYTDPRTIQTGCKLAAGADPNADSTASTLLTSTAAYDNCVKNYASGWTYVWLPYLATAALVVLALLLYVLLPHWKARAGKVVPLEHADRDGALRTVLERLADQSGLSRTPGFVINLAARKADALVFGRLGRYTVRIDGPLLTAFGRDRPAFEATLLHEYAHIRNRDVDITFLTVAIWRLFLLGALLPFVVRTGWLVGSGAAGHGDPLYWTGNAPYWARELVLSAFIVVLVYLVRADILRNREIYADIEAVRQGADRSRWAIHVPAGGHEPTRVVRALRAAVRTHPDWRARMAALADPAGLITVRARSMFLTGAAAEVLGYFLADTPGTGQYLTRYPGLGDADTWLPAALVTGIAGLAVWRSVVHSVRNKHPVPSGLRAGLWLGAGNLAGELLMNPESAHQWLIPFSEVLLLPLLLIVPTAVLWWTACCAALWADLPHRHRRLAAAGCTLATTGLAFNQLYGWWQTVDAFYNTGNPFGADYAYAAFYSELPHSPTMDTIAALTAPVLTLTDTANLVLTAALWLIPMIGLTRRTAWRPPPTEDPGRLRRRVRARGLSAGGVCGLIGGTAGALGVLVIAGRAHLWIHLGEQSPFQVLVIRSAWVFAILLAGATAAAIAASVATRGDAAAAMTAAGAAMAIGLAVLVAVIGTDGCVPPLSTYPTQCTPASGADRTTLLFVLKDLLSIAGIASLLAALLAAVFIKLWSPLDPAAPPAQVTAPRHARLVFRKAWTAPACVLLVGLCAVTFADKASGSSRGGDQAWDAQALANAPVVSPRLRTQQVRAWVYFGGRRLIKRYDDGVYAVARAAPGGKLDPPAMRRACAALISIAHQGQAYFPPPDAQKAAWSSVLATTITGARTCVDGVDHDDRKVIASGLRDIVTAQGTALQVVQRLAGESQGQV